MQSFVDISGKEKVVDPDNGNSLFNAQPGRTNLVEIIGPPGAGKSTVFNALIKTWSRRCIWNYDERRLQVKSEFYLLLRDIISGINGRKQKDKVNIRCGLEFIKRHPDLSNFLWDYLSDKQEYSVDYFDHRFRSAYFLFKDFCRLQHIAEKGSSKPFLIEEGLLQKSFLVNDDKERMRDIVSEYIELVPLPLAVIYVNTSDAEILVRRIKSREKVIASHIGLSNLQLLTNLERWQYLFGIIVAKLKQKDVKVIYLDGEARVDKNVTYLKHYLSNL